ncbi:MAG: VOC family protein [Sphingobium sp.]
MNAPLPSPFSDATFFQLGYVTRDIGRAMELWRTRYGVSDFLSFNGRDFAPPGATGPFLDVALAYRGDVMIELIQPDVNDPGIYGDALRDDGGVTLHHLGYLVDDARFATIVDDCAALAIPTPVVRSTGFCLVYADTRADSGLFTELVLPGPEVNRLFGAVPRN